MKEAKVEGKKEVLPNFSDFQCFSCNKVFKEKTHFDQHNKAKHGDDNSTKVSTPQKCLLQKAMGMVEDMSSGDEEEKSTWSDLMSEKTEVIPTISKVKSEAKPCNSKIP